MESVKCVTIGDGGVGKTCMLISYTKHEFLEKHVPTVFDQYDTIISDCPTEGTKARLGLWDTAGQEDYDRLRPLSYPDTDVFIICYAINSPTSLEHIGLKWIPEIHFHCPDTPFILVGTKSDMRGSGGESVKDGAAEAKGRELGAARVLECSAKTREGLDMVYREVVKVAMQFRAAHKKKPKCSIL